MDINKRKVEIILIPDFKEQPQNESTLKFLGV